MAERRTVKVRALVIIDDHGEYVVVGGTMGGKPETLAQLRLKMEDLWEYDPDRHEVEHFIEAEVPVPQRRAAPVVRGKSRRIHD